jgi:osmotically-inducible protein OsmY
MRTFFNGLLLGIIVGAGALWLYTMNYTTLNMQEAQRRAEAQTSKALTTAQSAAERAKQVLAARLDALELRADEIRKEAAETGKVVRQRARDLGDAVADAAVDARITAAVKTKLAADPDLSALGISVNTTAGRVTLAGAVAAPDLIGRAMALALETDGVRAVVSTLQVRQAETGKSG